ncbi:hypothetical protein GDO81_015639 [Engystomops pustulosus]|uniref:Uncharacterized protein n=1 Tax=Engystomops pustulosus TaxID=76066 RepID=A0AAV7ASW1_ENGPU|nr:hypothetical protein GDO81_015639 [Engystomops pustulosus]
MYSQKIITNFGEHWYCPGLSCSAGTVRAIVQRWYCPGLSCSAGTVPDYRAVLNPKLSRNTGTSGQYCAPIPPPRYCPGLLRARRASRIIGLSV